MEVAVFLPTIIECSHFLLFLHPGFSFFSLDICRSASYRAFRCIYFSPIGQITRYMDTYPLQPSVSLYFKLEGGPKRSQKVLLVSPPITLVDLWAFTPEIRRVPVDWGISLI
jgi:hypothetical protein